MYIHIYIYNRCTHMYTCVYTYGYIHMYMYIINNNNNNDINDRNNNDHIHNNNNNNNNNIAPRAAPCPRSALLTASQSQRGSSRARGCWSGLRRSAPAASILRYRLSPIGIDPARTKTHVLPMGSTQSDGNTLPSWARIGSANSPPPAAPRPAPAGSPR